MINIKHTRGYIMVLSLIFLAIFFVLTTAVVSTSTTFIRNENVLVASSQALHISEAGIEKALYELNQNPTYSGETNTIFGAGEFTTEITSINSTTKTITATAYVPNSTHPISTKTVRATATINQAVISFRYGVQGGVGGFSLSGGANINGSVYSNGNISILQGSRVTGSAVAANPPALSANQVNDSPTPISSCTSSTCITFGNSSATEDFAQSFQISETTAFNNIQFYIKKTGTPGNLTVRIVADNGGNPDSTTLLSGTLSSSAVTTSFGWVSVTLPTTPVLNAGQTYWILLDGGSHSSRYYQIGANSSYGNGTAKIGRVGSTWSNTTPSGLDGYFRIYLGGGVSTIGGENYSTGGYVGTTVSDETWANTVKGITASGPLYCTTGTNNNKSCNTTHGDPPVQAMPLSDPQIQEWKDDALTGGVTSGNVTVGYAGATLGPKKITGNVTVNGGGTLTVSGTLWIEGNLIVNGGGKIKLASSYGTNSGAIVVDGYVSLTGGANFDGSGQSGSYPFLISTSACPADAGCGGNNAIHLSGGAGTVALIAQDGTVSISGGSSVKQVTARQLTMNGGASLVYDSGLISESFSSGPGGSWNFLPGSYVIVD